jgi:hypothetical protein
VGAIARPVGTERVTLREGRNPIIFIAPHGYAHDDSNTGRICLEAAKFAKAFAVVNNGWERSEDVDAIAGKANCNNLYHLKQDVVCEEFFEPILRFQARCTKKFGYATLYFIHGVGAENSARIDEMDVILGFGNGRPPSFTMDESDRETMAMLFNDIGLFPYVGMAGGKYSGWARPNLNQYFRKWALDEDVNSVQVEVSHKHRVGPAAASVFGDALGMVALRFDKGDEPDGRCRFPEV